MSGAMVEYVQLSRSKMAGAVGAAAFGSILEFYLLYVAGLAAGEVWPKIFFQSSSASLAFILSIFAYMVTYFVRPVGALFFGHFGDRIGRKSQLIATILIVAVSSLIIGIMPGYAVIGVAAPVLLVLMRAIQGFGFGGEYGGASSLVAESVAHSKWRYLWTSFVQFPVSMALGLGALSFFYVGTAFKGAAFLNIGWRIPFIAGAIVGAIGVYIRYKVVESPIFEQVKKSHKVEKAPVSVAFKKYWRRMTVLSVAIIPIAFAPLLTVPFGIQYLAALHMSPANTSYAYAIAAFIPVPVMILSGAVASRIDRKKLFFLFSSAAGAIVGGLIFRILGAHPDVESVILGVGLLGAVLGWEWGLVPAVLPEAFDVGVRYTSAGFVLQFSQTIPAVIAALTQAYFITAYNGVIGAAPYVALTYAVVCGASFVASLMMKETHGLNELASSSNPADLGTASVE